MFCPNCGAEERNPGQFCRGCGRELQAVRIMLERSDSITDSAITARQEISRALAARIRELRTGDDLKQVVEDVLPQIEKFLESPEERRLRTLRNGIITSAIGLAITVAFVLMSLLSYNRNKDLEFIGAILGGGGFVLLLIGLSIIINARWFTVPHKEVGPPKPHTKQIEAPEIVTDRELRLDAPSNFPSVTEGTTRQLK
jgi:hypothetical protein